MHMFIPFYFPPQIKNKQYRLNEEYAFILENGAEHVRAM